jgi:hypothetical protein
MMIVTGIVAGVVWMSNVWLELPLGTVTVAGTIAASPLLVTVTTAPSLGAAAVNTIVPVTVVPLAAVVADTVTALNAAAVDDGDDGDDPHADNKRHVTRRAVVDEMWRTVAAALQTSAHVRAPCSHLAVTALPRNCHNS